jgi:hypothetical protein
MPSLQQKETPKCDREGMMGFKEDDRINRLAGLMWQETQIINEEIAIYKEIANAYGERTSQLLKETIERDKITNGTH